ncbi:multicomponent K+:H+ antiporter subunit E [Devosia crocina]|uniref:Multicomponent K+:H+ antiporter subunit E n=1 Tax=Devosia crocina TaxID=429728 RepID=A0A1I7NUS6_9HYPH|nr:Na+/H+ antiporter subunit E [Devosia crocina]SFV38404.1 multicomponent K+:H+ antiporter subunit E [Devosia crocina]
MKKLFPHPVLAALLLGLWLVLQQSIGFGHVLLGSIIAIGASLAAAKIIPEPVRIRNPHLLLKLAAIAGLDIVRSNIALLMVLGNPRPKPKAAFIEMKLELTDTFALAVLACLITATPGSAWLEYNREHSTVLIHVFDLVDAADWETTIRTRYEALLLEIFQ